MRRAGNGSASRTVARQTELDDEQQRQKGVHDGEDAKATELHGDGVLCRAGNMAVSGECGGGGWCDATEMGGELLLYGARTARVAILAQSQQGPSSRKSIEAARTYAS